MLEEHIKEVLKKRNLKPIDIYQPLKINRINFYKAIKSSNLNNSTLQKILNFLRLKIHITLKNDNQERVLSKNIQDQ